MTKFVSDSDVEDVLSSIRRLVSNDPADRAEPAGAAEENPDKLLLTPAFRVVAPEDRAGENTAFDGIGSGAAEAVESADAVQDAAGGMPAPEEDEDALSLEERIAELEAAVSLESVEWEPDGSEPSTDETPDAVLAGVSRPAADEAPMADMVAEEAPAEAELVPLTPVGAAEAPEADALGDAGDVEDMAHTAAEAVVEADVQDEAPADFDAPSDAPSPDENTAPVAEAPADPEPVDKPDDESEALTEPDTPPRAAAHLSVVPDAGAEAPESDALAPLEEAVTRAKRNLTLSAPAALSGDPAGTEAEEPETDADEAPPEFRHAAAAPPVAETPEPASDGGTGADALMDHDMLRDIVREILREELQGMLGERITRNMRKMVRQEVERALAARDFD